MNATLERLLIRLGLRREITIENAMSMFTKAMDNLEEVRTQREAEYAALEEHMRALKAQQQTAQEDYKKAARIKNNMRSIMED